MLCSHVVHACSHNDIVMLCPHIVHAYCYVVPSNTYVVHNVNFDTNHTPYGTGRNVQWTSHVSHCTVPYPTVRTVPLYHGTGRTVQWTSHVSHCTCAISHCPYRPTVPWDWTDCPVDIPCVPLHLCHIPLSVPSHCTVGLDGLSSGHPMCPTAPVPYPTVRTVPLYRGTGRTVQWTSHVSHCTCAISHCPYRPTVPWDWTDCPVDIPCVPLHLCHIPLSVPSHCAVDSPQGGICSVLHCILLQCWVIILCQCIVVIIKTEK